MSVRLAIEMALRGYPALGIPGQVADGLGKFLFYLFILFFALATIKWIVLLDGEVMSMRQEDEEEDIAEDLLAVFQVRIKYKILLCIYKAKSCRVLSQRSKMCH